MGELRMGLMDSLVWNMYQSLLTYISNIEVTFINKDILVFLEILIFVAPQMRVTKYAAVLNRPWPSKVVGCEDCSVTDSCLNYKLEK